jgi:apolipoprotein N-acyltransferase
MNRQIAELTGWRGIAASILAGVLSVLALAPFDLWPVMFLTMPVLFWRLERAAGLQAFLTGWLFGFGYFLAGLYWVGHSFLVEADVFGWLLPFAVTLLPAGLAIFYGLATLAASLAGRSHRIVVLALAFAIAEFLRGHVFTGFPWNALGYTLTSNDYLLQSAALFGVYTLGFIAVIIFTAPAAGGWRLPSLAAALMAVMFIFGHLRLAENPTRYHDDITLRIVQPNVAQAQKWLPANRRKVFEDLLAISRRAGLSDADYLIWPETAMPFALLSSPAALGMIADMLPAGTDLITGSIYSDEHKLFNSVLVLDSKAQLLSRYDKVKLVPFGEYLPLQNLLEAAGFEQLTRTKGGFAAGVGKVLETKNQTVALPLLCYEIIFPDMAITRSMAHDWIINLTNDAWFGNSTGPYQHLRQARVRAVEQGVPVIRSANTGISAVIDPLGRVIRKLPLNTGGIIDVKLPLRKKLFYSRLLLLTLQ